MDVYGSIETENRVFWVSLEVEFSLHAEVFAGAIGIDTSQDDLVVTIWGIRWNGPLQGVVHWVGGWEGIGMVLVVEWSTVPVNMNVDLGKRDVVGEGSNHFQSNILSFDEWVWISMSRVGVEGEDTLVIVALSPLNLGSGLDHLFTVEELLGGSGGGLEELWHEFELHEVLDVE